MGTFDALWDTQFAYPIYEYDDLTEALACVAATVHRLDDNAVATWGLDLSTPTGDIVDVIAEGAELARMAREHAAAAPAAMER